MKTKTILLVCAAGFATTSMMQMKIQDGLEERGIRDVEIKVATVGKIPYFIEGADVIVTSLSLEQADYGIPVIDGIGLLRGKGSDVLEAIIRELGLESQ